MPHSPGTASHPQERWVREGPSAWDEKRHPQEGRSGLWNTHLVHQQPEVRFDWHVYLVWPINLPPVQGETMRTEYKQGERRGCQKTPRTDSVTELFGNSPNLFQSRQPLLPTWHFALGRSAHSRRGGCPSRSGFHPRRCKMRMKTGEVVPTDCSRAQGTHRPPGPALGHHWPSHSDVAERSFQRTGRGRVSHTKLNMLREKREVGFG